MESILVVILISMLSQSSHIPTASDEFVLETDKRAYFHGEEVWITFTNNSNDTVYFKELHPYFIWGPDRDIVAPGMTVPAIINVPSTESLRWRWNQLHMRKIPTNLVPPGNYTATISVYDEELDPITTVATSFEIKPPRIRVDTNSTITDISNSQDLLEIRLNITGPIGTPGYCNLTIPVQLLNGTLAVIFDDNPKAYDLGQNATHSSAYLTYTHSDHNIRIISTITGDINGDRIVNYHDLFILAQAYGSQRGEPKWNSIADLNRDDKVNYNDLFKLARNFGKCL